MVPTELQPRQVTSRIFMSRKIGVALEDDRTREPHAVRHLQHAPAGRAHALHAPGERLGVQGFPARYAPDVRQRDCRRGRGRTGQQRRDGAKQSEFPAVAHRSPFVLACSEVYGFIISNRPTPRPTRMGKTTDGCRQKKTRTGLPPCITSSWEIFSSHGLDMTGLRHSTGTACCSACTCTPPPAAPPGRSPQG